LRKIERAIARLVGEQHAELLIHVEQRIDGDLEACGERCEIPGATTADADNVLHHL
jgi:hypothetical protein